jgi:hypothetical protein
MVFPQPIEFQVTFHWDGTKWSNVPNPEQGVLYGVSASSSTDVWAVGGGFVTPGTYTIHFIAPKRHVINRRQRGNGFRWTPRSALFL